MHRRLSLLIPPRSLFAAAIAAMLTVHHASAAIKTWVGGTDNWETPGNWSASGMPASLRIYFGINLFNLS